MAMASILGMLGAGANSTKNLPLSSAGADLGLGDQLQNDVSDKLDEMRKKRQMAASAMGGNQNAAQASLSPAILSLFGQG